MNNVNNNLIPIYDGRVLVNETALNDQAIKNVLESLSADSFKFRSQFVCDLITFFYLINSLLVSSFGYVLLFFCISFSRILRPTD